MKILTDDELVYSATSRCPCGAGLAHRDKCTPSDAWDCSDILTGRAIPKGQTGSQTHTGILPFMFYEIKSERQPSASGMTTRPSGVAKPFDLPAPKKACPTCGHEG